MQFWSRLVKIIKGNFLLILALVIGFFLRIIATNPGYLFAGDELMYGEAIYMYLNKNLSLHPQWMGYPPLVAWIMFLFFVVVFIPGAWIYYILTHFSELVSQFGGMYRTSGSIVMNLSNVFKLEILGKNWVNALYWGRDVTAIFGTGVILLTYLTAANLFNKKVALISAFLVAVNYRLVLSSHLGFIDMYTIFFVFLSFWAVSLLLKKPDLKHYIIVWVTVALSFLVKYQFHSFFPLILAHFYLSLANFSGIRQFLKKFFSKGVVLGGLIALLIVWAAHAYHFLNIEKVIAINRHEVLKYAFGRNSFDLFPISYLYHQAGIGPFLSIISIVGIFIGFTKKKFRLSSLLILSPLPLTAYLYFYYSHGGFYTRNIIVLIPIFLIFSAVFISNILDFALGEKRFLLKWLGLVIFSLTIFFSFRDHLINSATLASAYSKESQESLAKKWIEENIKENVVLGTDTNRLVPSNKNVKSVKLPHPNTAFSYRELLDERFDYAAVNTSFVHMYFLYWWMRQPLDRALKFWERPDDLLAQGYKILATRELFWEHGLKAFLTTWQAPAFNYAVFKIDKERLCNDMKLVQKGNLNSLDWIPLYYFPENKTSLYKNDSSGLVIKGERTLPGVIRWGSSSFEVKAGFCYEIAGNINLKENILKIERNGFLRIDFYKEKPQVILTARPLVTFVSERVYGDKGNHPLDIQVVVPADAKFATIGFQTDGSATDQILLELDVFESEIKSDKPEPTRLLLKDENILLYNMEGII